MVPLTTPAAPFRRDSRLIIRPKDNHRRQARQTGAREAESGANVVDLGKLPGYLGYQTRQAQAAVFRNFAQIMADVRVTPGEFSLLALVRQNPGIHQISLVRVYHLDKSTLSNSVKDLKNRALLNVVRDQNDRRYFGLWLTELGENVLDRATVRVEEQERVMDSVLAPGEREQLLNLLARIAHAFD